MPQLEIEYKTLLSKKEFKRLTHLYDKVSPIKQTNHYFETENFDLKAAKLSFRIRCFEDRAEMTLKIPQQVGTHEHNLDLTLDDAQAIISQQCLPINSITQLLIDRGFNLEQIKPTGSLTTYRREVALPIGLLAIDENHYANRLDYEIELEVNEAEQGKRDFEQFLKDQGIHFKYARSKVARFSQTLKSKN